MGNSIFSTAVPGIALLLALSVCAATGLPSEPAARVGPNAAAANLVRAALLAEAAGKGETRRELLHEAIKKDPDYALPHWCVGELRQGERWLSLEEVQRQAATDKRLAEYRRLRDRQLSTPAGQLALATWCRDHGLAAESRIHWTQVLMLQPENKEALKALGARWHQGQLLTDAQVQQEKAARNKQGRAAMSKKERQWMDHWVTAVADWRRGLRPGDASALASLRKEVIDAKDPLAIHTLGTVIINGSRQKSDATGYRLVSLALIDALDYCGEPWAVAQLARHAVEHPATEVRNAAADALKKRPKISYVPWLLSHRQAPIEARLVVSPGPAGAVFIQQTFEQEGPDAVYRDVLHQCYCAGTPRVSLDISYRNNTATYQSNIPQLAYKSWRDAENYAAATRNQVERFNATVTDLNQRIECAMSRATGEKMDADPSSWQRWWTKYCCDYYELEPTIPGEAAAGTAGATSDRSPYDYEQPPPEQKPVVEQEDYGVPPPTIVVSVSINSCFPWNTKVWTLTGPVDIIQIKPGDRVLSQQPSTGELSYEPVLQVTRRKPSPMIQVGLGKETIQATRGHPFWVCGEGWKMAKQLAVGMWLHSTEGPVLIDRVEQVPAAKLWYERPDGKPGEELSYNLVIDKRHNYFVGQQKVLAHDNTLFPLDGPVPAVPGLTAP